MSNWLVLVILCAPLVGGVIGYITPLRSFLTSVAGTAATFILAVYWLLKPEVSYYYAWSWLGDLQVSVQADNVSLLLIALVALISLLVQIFSVEYLREERGIDRYYAKLCFFVTAMIGLLLADNLLLLFVFWELVGLASYLLIGFWFSKEGIPTSARTAFMVNRVADAALLAGILMVYNEQDILSMQALTAGISFLPSLLIAVGAFGKSAQLPFSGWLVKAMVGPTPISALIHAATMVAAGVYLLYRVGPLLDADVLYIIAIVGVLTALYAAICAIFQFDIKKVLAYSTISQLGYMILGIGVGARDASLFHLFTHAFFKAGLFLGAASVIHYMHKATDVDGQDMRHMGGLKAELPWTYRSMLVSGLALAGLPLFSGFLSKDGILLGAWDFASDHGAWAYLVPDLALLTAAMTAFYVTRMLVLVFLGEKQLPTLNYAEGMSFSVPLVILSIFSVWILHHWNPFGHLSWLFESLDIPGYAAKGGELIPFLSTILALAGIVMAYSFFKPGTPYRVGFSQMQIPSSRGGALVFDGFGLTHAYEKVGRWSATLSKGFFWVDQKVIGVFIDLLAVSSVVVSKVLALVDRFAVDGPVNWSAGLAQFIGRRFSGLSSRDGQTQLMWLLLLVILILLWITLF